MEKTIIDLVKSYFKDNQKKNVLDMNNDEYSEMCKDCAVYCADEVMNVISGLHISDFYDAQDAGCKQSRPVKMEAPQKTAPVTVVCDVQKTAAKTENSKSESKIVRVKRKSGRPASAAKLGLYYVKEDIPANTKPEFICKVYARKNGTRVNEMYAVLDDTVDIKKAKNNVKSKYARFQNTHYMNVSMSRLTTTKNTRRPMPGAKDFGEYYLPN